jgi:hypothetical protein
MLVSLSYVEQIVSRKKSVMPGLGPVCYTPSLLSGLLGVVSVILFRDLVVWLEVTEVETHMVVRLLFSIY